MCKLLISLAGQSFRLVESSYLVLHFCQHSCQHNIEKLCDLLQSKAQQTIYMRNKASMYEFVRIAFLKAEPSMHD